MKTKILKWDVRIQTLLMLLSLVAFVLCFYPHHSFLPPWLLMGFALLYPGMYQVFGNIIHILLNHKSPGYKTWRQTFLAAEVGYSLLALLLTGWIFKGAVPDIIPAIIYTFIPLSFFIAYYLLCKKELGYLQYRDFFILK